MDILHGSIVCFLILGTTLSSVAQSLFQSDIPPDYPVGEEAYTHWTKLPYLRFGVRAYMRSTYDRQGNNRSADAGHFLYQENDSFNVSLDVKGQGILYFKRTNRFHGSPWHYEIDGHDLIVKETATDAPVDADIKFSKTEFIPQDLFPHPLTWTWSETKGANLMWRPLSFQHSFRIAYSRTFYGTGYYIYHLFPYDAASDFPLPPLSRPGIEILETISGAGTDLSPSGPAVTVESGQINLLEFDRQEIDLIRHDPAMIRAIKFTIPRASAVDFGRCKLIINWDNRWRPSVDVPLDLFFGAGMLHNSDNREYLVKSLPITIRYSRDSVHLACFWPMPFFENANVVLQEKSGKEVQGIHWEIITVPYTDPMNHVAYFHATYSDHPSPQKGVDLTFLDTRSVEGGGDWTGHFVGMSWIFSRRGVLNTLEGDPRIFLDDSRTPQGWGTGTEEWGGGGDYWGGENMTIPLAGHPLGKKLDEITHPLDSINSAYRFLIADYFPFGKRAVINLEHGGINNSTEHYSGVCYWYGIDAASLVLTDALAVFNPEDARRHNYKCTSASEPYALVSRYEWGPDHDLQSQHSLSPGQKGQFYGATMYYPAEQDSVQTMDGTAEFRMALEADNQGVLLRRKFDYLYPNQQAKVFVKDAESTIWQYAGIWYTAGSNTCVYSRPSGKNFSVAELAPTEHNVITSNRRWREEEFIIAKRLTQGRDHLDIKIVFVPNEKDLYPGYPFPAPTKWSASRYWVYSYVMPYLHKEIHKGGIDPLDKY